MAWLSRPGRVVACAALFVVAFAYWPALFAGGSLAPVDQAQAVAPFAAELDGVPQVESSPLASLEVHAARSSLADDVRAGEVSWWDRESGLGRPSFADGVAVFELPYLVLPGWFAPGFVAALRTLAALAFTYRLGRLHALGRAGAAVAGLVYAFSGMLVATINEPASSVAALVPGLALGALTVIDEPGGRWAALTGLCGAAMIWSDAPGVLAYGVLATVVLVAARWRSVGRRASGAGLRLAGAVAVALGIGAPHLFAARSYDRWLGIDEGGGHTAAGVDALLTMVSPVAWGSDAHGLAFFGDGVWHDRIAHVGAAALVLAVIGVAYRRRREPGVGGAAVGGFVILALGGSAIAYLGGPIAAAVASAIGAGSEPLTHARVVSSLGLALLAGVGADVLVRTPGFGRRSVLAGTRLALALVAVLAAATIPSLVRWLDAAQAAGVTRAVVAHSTVAVLAALVVGGLMVARVRGAVSPAATAVVLVVVVAVEVLAFAMPVPTIAKRSERLSVTSTHTAALLELEAGERVAARGETFFPAASALFGIADVRVADSGTPLLDTAADLDAAAVGLWVLDPAERPPGSVAEPEPGAGSRADLALGEVSGATEVPEGGLRAVLVAVEVSARTQLHMRVNVGGESFSQSRWVEPSDSGVMSFPVAADDHESGRAVSIGLRAQGEPASATAVLGVDARVPVGTVAGDDGERLVHSSGAILMARPSAEFVVVDSASGSVTDLTVSADRVTITVDVEEASTLVVRQPAAPGWRATVDGRLVAIEADGFGSSRVPVDAATRVVELRYHPQHVAWTLPGALAGLALAAAMTAGRRRSGW